MIASDSDQPVTIRNAAITASNILPAHRNTTSLVLRTCTADDWRQIGQALASMRQLQTLAVLHCNAGDALCRGLAKSESLLRLRFGTSSRDSEQCGITEEGVAQITKMQQLQELRVGKSADYKDDEGAITKYAYRCIFYSLPNLLQLQMRQPALQ